LRGADEGRRRADDARDASLKTVVEHLADVTERSQHIVRDEIELAKAEVAQKVGSLGRGAAVGVAAGVFIALGGLFVLFGLAFLLGQELFSNNIYWGFFVVAALLFLLAAIGGLLAYKFVKKGAPPVPTMAIDEAKLIRSSVQDAASSSPGELGHGPSRTLGGAGASAVAGPPRSAATTDRSQGGSHES
jgi:hypothetical protein